MEPRIGIVLVAVLVGLLLSGCSPAQKRGIEGIKYIQRVTSEGSEGYYDVDRDADYDGDGVPDRRDRYPADPSSASEEGDLLPRSERANVSGPASGPATRPAAPK